MGNVTITPLPHGAGSPAVTGIPSGPTGSIALAGGTLLEPGEEGNVLVSAGPGSAPVYSDTPAVRALKMTVGTPAVLVDGMVWMEASGVSPDRVVRLLARDQGVTVEFARIVR